MPAASGSANLRRCLVAPGLSVDEHDLSLLLQAKAAVLSGAQMLLRAGGVEPGQLQALHVAGGFGKHLNAAHALLAPRFCRRCRWSASKSWATRLWRPASSALLNSHAYGEMRRSRGASRSLS